jgi:hypothetical protein
MLALPKIFPRLRIAVQVAGSDNTALVKSYTVFRAEPISAPPAFPY